MIKNLLTFIFSITSVIVFAQTDSLGNDMERSKVIIEPDRNNEWKVNLIMTISGLPEFAYERIISNKVGVGLSVLVRLDKRRDYNFGFVPHYRYYLGKQKANVFFIEGNTAVYSVVDYQRWVNATERNNYTHHNEPSTLELGMGIAAGGKFISKRGFFVETSLGFGKFLTKTHLGDYSDLDFSVGKRF